MKQKSLDKLKQERRQVYEEIVGAFEEKYSWLGHQAARQLLLSAATWNIEKHSDPHMRYRNHVMLAWERGWLKSSILRKMADILGDEFTSTIGKVTDAAMRGSVSAGQFMPPKPLKSPIVISTEFGQTEFDDELLNLFLALLEESRTNVALNKIGQLAENSKRNVESEYDNQITFQSQNEFELRTDFVFWGATYDPAKLEDDALRSRFEVVTPAKELDATITRSIDNNRFSLNNTTITDVRTMLQSKRKMETDFAPPDHLYSKYKLIPRESRDVQAHMAARNWWGLEVNSEIMESYIKHLKKSRRLSTMSPEDRIFDAIFDNPMTLEELEEETRFEKQEIFKILQKLPANPFNMTKGDTKYVIRSGQSKEQGGSEDGGLEEEEEENKDPVKQFMSQ